MTESTLNCGSCRACCKKETIILHPEHGDDPSQYQTADAYDPISNERRIMLDHKENGDCIYLGEEGCTIYERRPHICRAFDCRINYLTLTKAIRRALVEKGMAGAEEMEAGRKRIHTLSHQEKQECFQTRDRRLGR